MKSITALEHLLRPFPLFLLHDHHRRRLGLHHLHPVHHHHRLFRRRRHPDPLDRHAEDRSCRLARRRDRDLL